MCASMVATLRLNESCVCVLNDLRMSVSPTAEHIREGEETFDGSSSAIGCFQSKQQRHWLLSVEAAAPLAHVQAASLPC